MGSPVARLTSSIGLALGLGLTFTPLGCGSGQEFTVEPSHHAHEGPSVPRATVAQLTDCTNEGAARLTDTSYAILFDVDVDVDGRVKGARVKDSLLGDRGIESCMVHALRGMSLPASILRRAGRVSPESRQYVGNAAAGVLVALGPIVLVAAGITFIVVVSVYVVSETATSTRDAIDEDAEKERCKKVKNKCIGDCQKTLPTPDHGFKFWNCVNKCMEVEGCR
jgi:hypothetical protein